MKEKEYEEKIVKLQEECRKKFSEKMTELGFTVYNRPNSRDITPGATALKKGFLVFELIMFTGAVLEYDDSFVSICVSNDQTTSKPRAYYSTDKNHRKNGEEDVLNRFDQMLKDITENWADVEAIDFKEDRRVY